MGKHGGGGSHLREIERARITVTHEPRSRPTLNCHPSESWDPTLIIHHPSGHHFRVAT